MDIWWGLINGCFLNYLISCLKGSEEVNRPHSFKKQEKSKVINSLEIILDYDCDECNAN